MQKTLGGDRLGSGNKMKVDLHGYERSTHNLSYLWRSTMASGTLVPFMSRVALPGDTWDIQLNTEMMTHPTIGPLFASYKAQLDIFLAPLRLYNSLLHNNALGIGLKMSKVKLPVITLTAQAETPTNDETINTSQINPSCILAYLGIRGVGFNGEATAKTRDFNAIPILAYWDIYKNYYANKQEEIGAVLHTPSETNVETVDYVSATTEGNEQEITEAPSTFPINLVLGTVLNIGFTGTEPIAEQIIINTLELGDKTLDELAAIPFSLSAPGILSAPFRQTFWGNLTALSWRYRDVNDINNGKPAIVTFDLDNIDAMRSAILADSSTTTPFNIGTPTLSPYNLVNSVAANGTPSALSSQEGLALKTYQSDLFNNWLQTEWIDGVDGISAITAVDTSGGNFTIDTLNLSKKVYDMLNRIAVSGGTYDDWLDAVYDHPRYLRCETPMYMGGLIKELVFQEVISNAQSETQPLGTLGGRGILAQKHKGGDITIKVDEPGYIIGIISLTPRIDYSQGNNWDVNLQTLDDLHKPALDEIGFQELITEQLAWWDTQYNVGTTSWEQFSAGKQPAWINYMTDINRTYGNFAIPDNEMFMTLNRRYEANEITGRIKDLTTYIDPSKFNFVFAETSLDAQNFWAQIAVDITLRRKISAKLMPNL